MCVCVRERDRQTGRQRQTETRRTGAEGGAGTRGAGATGATGLEVGAGYVPVDKFDLLHHLLRRGVAVVDGPHP